MCPLESQIVGGPPVASAKPLAQPLDRVLLVEDSHADRKRIGRLLRSLGLEVTTAHDGREALLIALLNVGFDLVVMDIDMSNMDGIEATILFRHGGYQGPIIAVSSSEKDNIVIRCIAAGCNAFARKPLNEQEFIAIVRGHLQASSQRPARAG